MPMAGELNTMAGELNTVAGEDGELNTVAGEHGSESGGGRPPGGSGKVPLVVAACCPGVSPGASPDTSACCGEERLLLRPALERLAISSVRCRCRYASVSCEVSG